jgi:LysM repeat protein
MTQAILLQSLTEIVTIGLLFTSPPASSMTPTISPIPEKAVLAAVIKKEPSYYVVKQGQTLDEIAKDAYGKTTYWTSLWNDNPWLSDPAMIHTGDKLLLRDVHPSAVEDLKRPLPTPTLTPTPTITPTPTVAPVTAPAANLPLDQVYMDAGNKFGVPWQILYAIHVVETGQRDGPIDSGFGPQGPMQFLPSTFAAYATDGNGDGVTDINNAADAIYTAASYIARHGSLDAALKSYGNTSEAVKRVAMTRGWSE